MDLLFNLNTATYCYALSLSTGELQDQLRLTSSDLEGDIHPNQKRTYAPAVMPSSVSRAALADAKATIADVTQLRWEVEGRESDLKQQVAAVSAERDDLKTKLNVQQEDSVQVHHLCHYVLKNLTHFS